MKLLPAAVLTAVLTTLALPTSLTAVATGSTAPAAVPMAASADACGLQPLKPDGTPWQCSFVDDFSGTALNRAKWVPQTIFATGSATGRACYIDSPSVITVWGGVLNLTVRKLSRSLTCNTGSGTLTTRYVAGMVSTYRLFSQQYGRFEARIKTRATSVPGLHEAFWLWPDDQYSTIAWPSTGEIDVSETYSVYPTLSVPFLHYAADALGPQPGVNTAWTCTALRGQWNTYTLEWGPSRIQILVNGKSCLVNTSADPAFAKRYIVALTAALGQGANAMTASTPLPATVSVDYVRVWR